MAFTEQTHRPGDDDEEVESVPSVGEVRVLTDEAHRQHFDAHLDGEVGVDGVIGGFEDVAARSGTRHVGTRLIEAERHAVQQDHRHRRPLEPRDNMLRQGNIASRVDTGQLSSLGPTQHNPQYLATHDETNTA